MDLGLFEWLESANVQDAEQLVNKFKKLKISSVYQLSQSLDAQQLAKENMTLLSKKRFDISLNSFTVNYLSGAMAITRNESKRLKMAISSTNEFQQRKEKEANVIHHNRQLEFSRLTALEEKARLTALEEGEKWPCQQCQLLNRESAAICVACSTSRYLTKRITRQNAKSQSLPTVPTQNSKEPSKQKQSEICTVCTDPFTKAEGFCCANGHFMCWETCFDGYVQSASTPGAIQGYCDAAGNLLCPEPKCKLPYNLQTLAGCGPPRVFQALMDLQFAVRSTREVSIALQVQQRQLTAEFARIQAMTNLDERDAHILRREIVDTVLTLRCPRCKTAFVDFDGCFALSCGVNQCGAGFCAWCLTDCGGDAHSHVLQCPENKSRTYYGTIVEFETHHRERRKSQVQHLVERRTPEVQHFAKLILKKDLEELGIRL